MINRTKNMFADKIQELAGYKSIKEIQIKELCELCEVERSTFYYHFKDKYDLIAWIFQQYYIEEEKVAEHINDEEMIFRMLTRLYNHRHFFSEALRDSSQNNLREYMVEFYIAYERKVICSYLKRDVLDHETEYMIAQYSYGCMGNTIDWLLEKTNYSIREMAHFQYEYMPEILKKAFKRQNSDNHK